MKVGYRQLAWIRILSSEVQELNACLLVINFSRKTPAAVLPPDQTPQKSSGAATASVRAAVQSGPITLCDLKSLVYALL